MFWKLMATRQEQHNSETNQDRSANPSSIIDRAKLYIETPTYPDNCPETDNENTVNVNQKIQ